MRQARGVDRIEHHVTSAWKFGGTTILPSTRTAPRPLKFLSRAALVSSSHFRTPSVGTVVGAFRQMVSALAAVSFRERVARWASGGGTQLLLAFVRISRAGSQRKGGPHTPT